MQAPIIKRSGVHANILAEKLTAIANPL